MCPSYKTPTAPPHGVSETAFSVTSVPCFLHHSYQTDHQNSCLQYLNKCFKCKSSLLQFQIWWIQLTGNMTSSKITWPVDHSLAEGLVFVHGAWKSINMLIQVKCDIWPFWPQRDIQHCFSKMDFIWHSLQKQRIHFLGDKCEILQNYISLASCWNYQPHTENMCNSSVPYR
jgi:hypothetical protein